MNPLAEAALVFGLDFHLGRLFARYRFRSSRHRAARGTKRLVPTEGRAVGVAFEVVSEVRSEARRSRTASGASCARTARRPRASAGRTHPGAPAAAATRPARRAAASARATRAGRACTAPGAGATGSVIRATTYRQCKQHEGDSAKRTEPRETSHARGAMRNVCLSRMSRICPRDAGPVRSLRSRCRTAPRTNRSPSCAGAADSSGFELGT